MAHPKSIGQNRSRDERPHEVRAVGRVRARPKPSAARYLPARQSYASLRAAAADCHGCDLYKHATQTVFGEGKVRAPVMFVGEVPGDVEDLTGHVFVGPAGRLLRKAMEAAGLDARDVYMTNAVKHFKFVERGKRRIHQKPKRIEIQACRPWLEAEIDLVKPHIVLALGAVAAGALLGPSFRLSHHRGEFVRSNTGARIMATMHPSAILRAPDSAARRKATARLVNDLRTIARSLRQK